MSTVNVSQGCGAVELDIKEMGRRIRSMRLAAKLTQEAAAAGAELDTSFWSQLEGGRYENPGLRTLVRVARAIGTSVSYIIGETDDPRPIIQPGQAAHHTDSMYGPMDLTPEDIQDLERAYLEIERRRAERKRRQTGGGGP